MSMQLIQAKGYSWRRGKFRSLFVLPTGDEAEEAAVRYNAGAIEYHNGTQWIRIGESYGGYQLFGQFRVQEGGTIVPGALGYTSDNLVGSFVDVFLNGILLPTGIEGQQGYVYNILTGEISFSSELNVDDVLRIYTYSPSVSAGNVTMAAGFEDIVQSGSPRFIQCLSDTVNGNGETTLYYWTGSALIFIVVQDVV